MAFVGGRVRYQSRLDQSLHVCAIDVGFHIDIGNIYIHVQLFYRFRAFWIVKYEIILSVEYSSLHLSYYFVIIWIASLNIVQTSEISPRIAYCFYVICATGVLTRESRPGNWRTILFKCFTFPALSCSSNFGLSTNNTWTRWFKSTSNTSSHIISYRFMNINRYLEFIYTPWTPSVWKYPVWRRIWIPPP
jgi:hypothetical protein